MKERMPKNPGCHFTASSGTMTHTSERELDLRRVICACSKYYTVNMENAVFIRIGHAPGKLTGSIWLPCAADLPIAHIG